jgi:UDP-3-O-[3-hydroxymyristoyl] glucosamine N-acyltransferase
VEHFQLKIRVGLLDLLPAKSCNSSLDVEIVGIGQLGIPTEEYLTFCDRPVYSPTANEECRSLILTSRKHVESVVAAYPNGKVILVEDPRAIFIDVAQFLVREQQLCYSSLLPEHLTVSPDAAISERAHIESDVRIDAGAVVAAGAVIRSGTWLQSNASVGENCVVGPNGIHVYLGQDGRRRTFPHLGGVIVEKEASLGAGCVVPKGILNSTRIGANTIIGNLCNIGHGADIGSNVWISTSTAIGGQTWIGQGVTIALGCAIKDNIVIGDHANIGMGAVVTKNVGPSQSVFGNPAKTFASVNAGPRR